MIPESFLSCHQKKLLAVRRKQLSPEFEQSLHDRGTQIAMDGSILLDGDDVYVFDAPFQYRVQRIAYFGDTYYGMPIAQLCADEEGALAINMVQLGWWGNAVKCITVLQRQWRRRKRNRKRKRQ